MPSANKTTRIRTKCYYPPRGLYESIEPREEESQEQEVDSLAPAPTPKPFQEEPEEEEPEEVDVVELSDDEEEDAVQEDEPIPHLGWTTEVWYKPGCESSISHHRLIRILQTYYGDWDAAVEYVCTERTHPLEDTYWKTGCASPSRMNKRKHTS